MVDASGRHFEILWTVNPNAVKGSATLKVSAENSDGKVILVAEVSLPPLLTSALQVIPLHREGSKNAVQYAVTIGGDINVVHNSFSTRSLRSEKTVFVTEFRLFCAGECYPLG